MEYSPTRRSARKVVIDFTQIDKASVDPAQADMEDVYAHPYEEIRIEIQPSSGAKLTAERVIPQVSNIVMGF